MKTWTNQVEILYLYKSIYESQWEEEKQYANFNKFFFYFNSFKADWMKAAEYAEKLSTESKWSKVGQSFFFF